MFRNGLTFAQQDDRRKNKVDANMDDNRKPNDDAVCLREIKHQNISANAEFDQSHAVEVEELAKPQIPKVPLQVFWCLDWIPNMSSTTDFSCLVGKSGAGHC